MDKLSKQIKELQDIIIRLTAPDGCPWDREQTPQSVKKYILEESYELVEAIEEDNSDEVCEEIGDLFFMLLFLAHMYEQQHKFMLHNCLKKVAQKMIRRHPHIFGNVEATKTSEVVANWQAIKAEESKQKGKKHSALGNLPKAMPALQRAFRLGERASRVGFDWKAAEDVWEKFNEEQLELQKAIKDGDKKAIKEELGDLLFTVANLARLLDINPEEALQNCNSKFMSRFHKMEAFVERDGKSLADLNSDLLEELWNKAKTSSE